MRLTRLAAAAPAALLAFAMVPAAIAHTPLFSCYDNGDGTVLCEGGFSDGSSAAGTRTAVLDGNGTVLLEGSLDDFGEFIFDIPDGNYTVLFDAGDGHQIEIPDEDIF